MPQVEVEVYHAVDLTAPWGKGGCVVKVQQKQRAGGASGFSLDEVPIFAASQGHANIAKLLDAWLSPGIFLIAMADAGGGRRRLAGGLGRGEEV